MRPCFTKTNPAVSKAFWNEAKRHLAKGLEPEEVIRAIAKDYNLGTDQVGSVLAEDRNLFPLTTKAWAKQAKVSELKFFAKRTIKELDTPGVLKAFRRAYEIPRQLLTIGHGGVIPFTHARSSLFIPGEAMIFNRTVWRAYSYMTPNTGAARWRADMAKLRSDSTYNFWRRHGLEINLQSQPIGMGMSRWTRHSFDALKTMRLELAKKYWKQLDATDRSGPMAKEIAKKINHATGSVDLAPALSKIAGQTMFAPKLRFAKYASGISDPLTSRFGAKRFAKLAAVNLGILSINDLVNRYVFQTNDRVNWTDPTKADWLRAKMFGMTIPMAPMFETARLPINMAATLMDPRQDDKLRVFGKELASAAHPTVSAAYGLATGKDLATGKNLPFKGLSQYLYGEHRTKKPERQISGKEYAAGFAPIPGQPILEEMAKEGVPPDYGTAFLEAVLSGGAGTHVYPSIDYEKKKQGKGQSFYLGR